MKSENNNSIVLISPSKKYPGGIYHYTIKTALELQKHMNVDVISFKAQYPKFIYPGKQKTENLVDLKFENEYEILKWYDYSSWKNAFKIIKKANILYVPWWTILLTLPILFLTKLSKKKSLKVIIEFHNIYDHEAGKINKILTSFIIKRLVNNSDLSILHTKENSDKLNEIIKSKVNSIILPLGPLNNFEDLDDPVEIYNVYNLNKEKKFILMFGVVRKYKGLEFAIKAMKHLNLYSNYQLLVVGEVWINLRKEKDLIKKFRLKDKIIFIDHFIPDKYLFQFFKISEIIIYPYTSATQSGSLNIALSAKKPIIATTVGGFKEILEDQVNCLLIPPQNSDKLASSILKLIKNPEFATKIGKSGYDYIQNKISWNAIIEEILNAIRRL